MTAQCPTTPARPPARAHLPESGADHGPVVWADDGAEHIDTVALGWTGREVYVRMPDRRYQFTAVWLAAADVTRR
jgi:hypothetical protein